ncbi:MAG: hypothetical protein ACXQS8_03575, partial [Candidatus Helarchaeales archaeon]
TNYINPHFTVSHRVLGFTSIAFILGTSTIALIISLKWFDNAGLPMLVFAVLSFLGILVNLLMFIFGLRNVEYAVPFIIGTTPTTFIPYPLPIVIIVLLYDGIFEFAGIYLLLYVIAVKLFNARPPEETENA